jgi:hypothetical protein
LVSNRFQYDPPSPTQGQGSYTSFNKQALRWFGLAAAMPF